MNKNDKNATIQAQSRQVTRVVVKGNKKHADAPNPCMPRYAGPQ